MRMGFLRREGTIVRMILPLLSVIIIYDHSNHDSDHDHDSSIGIFISITRMNDLILCLLIPPRRPARGEGNHQL